MPSASNLVELYVRDVGGGANKLHHLTSILSSLDARGNDLSKAFKIKVLAFILSYEKIKFLVAHILGDIQK